MSEIAHRFIRFFIVVLGVSAFSIVLYFFSVVAYPFIIAFLIAIFINPAVNFLQKKAGFPRPLAIFAVLGIIFGLICTLLILLVAELLSGAEHLAKTIPGLVNDIVISISEWFATKVTPFFTNLAGQFVPLNESQKEALVENIHEVLNNLAYSATFLLQDALSFLPGILGWFPNAVMVLVFSVLATFFISNEWMSIKNSFERLLPHYVQKSSLKVYKNLRDTLFGYVRAQITLIFISFLIILLGLFILKIQYALISALLIAIVDLLPILGPGLIFIPWILYQYFSGEISIAVGLLVIYVVMTVVRQILEPKIVSSQIGLSPLLTLLAIFMGLKIFGFIGFFLGPLIFILILALYRNGVLQDLWKFILG